MRNAACLIVAILVLGPRALWAQTVPATHSPLRIFLDCYECDSEYLRQNVTFVDYVRDRTDADLHVLVTTQGTGGGGRSWTARFIGLGRFESVDRVHLFTTPQSATSDDVRKAFARVFRLGLAGYAADTDVARELELVVPQPAVAAATRRDPWHLWVFRVSGNGSVNGEASTSSSRYNLSASANRVTESVKINTSVYKSADESRYTLSDGRIINSLSDSWSAYSVAVKSLGPKFSVGGRLAASHSSYSNEARALSIYPGFEYDFFPYSEYQNRSLTIWYEAGPSFYRYNEVTVFDKLEETVTRQQMDFSLALRQPWGSLRAFTGISQQIPDWHKYRISINGNTDVRLFKGFSFNLYASYSRIRNQIALPREDVSLDELLLRLQQLATDHSYSYGFGVSYSFGSIFNTVVNPRFNGQNFFFF